MVNLYENPFQISLTGLEIKDWIWHNIQKKTKYTALAKSMNAFFNLDNDKFYILKLCGEVPIATEVPERGKKYENPCDD